MRNFCIVLGFILTLFLACSVTQDTSVMPSTTQANTRVSQSPQKAKNVILMIGDGMGLGQISAGMYAQGNKTSLERFPVIGLHKPHASNQLITDSAAAATAFACGVKTYNGAIGVNADTIPKQSILEEAELKGKSTGLIATSTIVHATPASFISHNKYRKNYEEIAEDFLDTEIDYFVGGGKKYFDRREKDDRDLLAELRNNDYVVKDFTTDFDPSLIDNSKNFAYITADSDPLKVDQGRDYLKPASDAAVRYLDQKNDNGFFLMIEGSQIDWGGHANLQEYVISEFIEFDGVINNVLDWVKEDGETLLIVTADHETGGFAIQNKSTMDSLVTAFTSTKHTGTMIPVFAYGPGAAAFSGIYENTSIYDKMREAFGW